MATKPTDPPAPIYLICGTACHRNDGCVVHGLGCPQQSLLGVDRPTGLGCLGELCSIEHDDKVLVCALARRPPRGAGQAVTCFVHQVAMRSLLGSGQAVLAPHAVGISLRASSILACSQAVAHGGWPGRSPASCTGGRAVARGVGPGGSRMARLKALS